ncbi:tyrosine-type recombinase/integrase [Profundibacter sp.]
MTAIQVKNAGDGRLYDGGGLMLVRTNDAGKWVWRYSYLGRRRDMGLGPQNAITLAEARKMRDRWAAVLAKGDDPISMRDAERKAARREMDRQDPTFERMAQIVFEAKRDALRGGGTRGRWMSPITLYMVPALGRKRMSAIHQSDIHAALKPIWRAKHPTAIKAINRTKIIFEQARLMGVNCDPFTVEAAKHMLGEVDHKVRHLKAVPWQEVPALFAKLAEPSAVNLCLRWCILTLVRSHGCRGARFEEIEGGLWTVPAARIKGRSAHVQDFRVPLSKACRKIVAEASEVSDDYLFPGLTRGHVSDVALSKALKRIGASGTLHGFRTSFRTWVQDTDACTFEVAETVLGHRIGGTVERSYARSDLLERRRVVMEKWAGFVTQRPADVVRIIR